MDRDGDSARHVALAVGSRRSLLEILRAATSPLGVAVLADAVGVHVTTARAHLQVLERAGLVRREPERGGRAGRPRQLYTAVEGSWADVGYRRLAEVLAGELAEDAEQGPRRAEQAGRRWASTLLPAPLRCSPSQRGRQVRDLFDRLGFAPRLVDHPSGQRVELAACPFRAAARSHPQIVCTVHLGLLRGALERWGAPHSRRAQLTPFVEPELCVAELDGRPGERP